MGDTTQAPGGEIILYETKDGRSRIDCRFEGDTLWLTQAQMAELFERSVPTINEHLRSVFEDGELDASATVRKFRIVRSEGKRNVSREIEHYDLTAILSVGYRVRSPRGVQFRQWATSVLHEYMAKGFVLDDQRLKNPPGPGVPDYFDELHERIRDIRASERRMYLRVRDIFALAADYASSQSQDTERFFRIIQNKLHFAVTGLTAPELIARRANAHQPNMGLTAWAGTRVLKADVTVAKNYLHDDEITELNRIVSMWLDFAEDQASRRKQVFLRDWESKLDDFLKFNDRDVLPDGGTVTRMEAESRARAEYDDFAARRRVEREVAGEDDALRALEEAAGHARQK